MRADDCCDAPDLAAVQQNIAYKRELLAGDIIETRSALVEIREKSIRFPARDAQASTTIT
jgi:acyl-CoA thioester hydrolase